MSAPALFFKTNKETSIAFRLFVSVTLDGSCFGISPPTLLFITLLGICTDFPCFFKHPYEAYISPHGSSSGYP